MRNIITVLREKIQRRKPSRLPAYERGWLAGVIDGDGSLMLKRFGNTFRVCVTVTNTNILIIEHSLKITNQGHFWKSERHSEKLKTVYVWELEGQQAKQVLSQLVLVGKEQQRKLLLEAEDLIQQHGAGYTPYVQRLEKIRQQIHKLNRKGAF